jgi:hypothetical protein
MAKRNLVLNREAIRTLSPTEKHMNAGHSLWTCDVERTWRPWNTPDAARNGGNGNAQ